MTLKRTEKEDVGNEELKKNLRTAIPQILAVSVKNVLLIGFGMTLGIPTVLIPNLSEDNTDEELSLNSDQLSWISSLNLICVPIGCLLSGYTTTTIGRKRTMQFVNIPLFISWLIYYFSQQVWHIYLALCLTGLGGGLLEAPVLTYVAEVTQPHLRGLLSATSTFSIILGTLIEFILATFLSWRMVTLTSCVAPIIAFFLLFTIPESPYWLITKSRMDEAQLSLAWLRGWTKKENVQNEFIDLCKVAANVQTELTRKEKLKNFTKKNFIWPFCLVSFVFFVEHFSGMTTLQTYAVQIFSSLHSPIDAYNATVFLGVAELTGCVVCVVFIHYVGKRVLTFISLMGNCVCLAIIGAYAYYYNLNALVSSSSSKNSTSTNFDQDQTDGELVIAYDWVPTTVLIFSAFLTHTGIRILPWILTGEVYAKETRAIASGLTSAIGYIFGFLANKLFLTMVSGMTLPGSFWFNCAFCFISTLILYFVLPETEGKLLYEITNHFNGVSKLDNKVYRKSKRLLSAHINNGFTKDEEITAESKF